MLSVVVELFGSSEAGILHIKDLEKVVMDLASAKPASALVTCEAALQLVVVVGGRSRHLMSSA